jgi:hypothetical protein
MEVHVWEYSEALKMLADVASLEADQFDVTWCGR